MPTGGKEGRREGMGDDDDHSPTTRSVSKTCELNASLHDTCHVWQQSSLGVLQTPATSAATAVTLRIATRALYCTGLSGKPKHEHPPKTNRQQRKATRSTSFSAKRTARCSATSQKSLRQEGNQDNKRSLRTTKGRELTDQDTRQAAIQGEHANI